MSFVQTGQMFVVQTGQMLSVARTMHFDQYRKCVMAQTLTQCEELNVRHHDLLVQRDGRDIVEAKCISATQLACCHVTKANGITSMKCGRGQKVAK